MKTIIEQISSLTERGEKREQKIRFVFTENSLEIHNLVSVFYLTSLANNIEDSDFAWPRRRMRTELLLSRAGHSASSPSPPSLLGLQTGWHKPGNRWAKMLIASWGDSYKTCLLSFDFQYLSGYWVLLFPTVLCSFQRLGNTPRKHSGMWDK